MRHTLALVALVVGVSTASAHGLLIPEEKSVPPLAMLNHKVNITINDQVATTKVEQTFRNHTNRQLEATYIFPVPKEASVNKFTMLVDGKETKGELVEAKKARSIYTAIVRRTQDPGLLEYMDHNLFRLRVFPIPPKADQKVSLFYTSVANREAELVEYIYPLKTDGKATSTLEEFSIKATIESQHGVSNVYSPTHAISLQRKNDNTVAVSFDRNQGLLDKDFQMFYSLSDKDVGLTTLLHRPIAAEDGYFTMLVTPKVKLGKEYQVPRDMVLVLDTSGSMRGPKMEQARNAMKYCLRNLTKGDRFALVNFATTVNTYREKLVDHDEDQLTQANKWVDNLEATGGTAINDALARALEYRAEDEGRTFTVVFFTDGLPTIGETNVEKILASTLEKNTSNTRMFTFGVGDDVNATMLDQLAEKTRALATYVRPAEDIEAKVSGLYSKISHPVLANLKLVSTGEVALAEMYPPQLPDLFHGSQLVVMGRYSGQGPSALKLSGRIGKETKEFVYELSFPNKTKEEKEFVEHLWARRKVGYLLDQIRANGEKAELVDEVTKLAKKYGITTPYTSWLIVPDNVTAPVADLPGDGGRRGRPEVSLTPSPVSSGEPNPFGAQSRGSGGPAPGLVSPKPTDPTSAPKPKPVIEFAQENASAPGGISSARGKYTDEKLEGVKPTSTTYSVGGEVKDLKQSLDRARTVLQNRDQQAAQQGQLGVKLSIQTANLRHQVRLAERTALRNVYGRNCVEIGGVWIDEGFDAKMNVVQIKAQSDAYFRLLERHPKLKDVFQLGNHLVWVSPNNTAIVVDASNGKEKLSDKEIDALFVVKK